MVQVITMPSLRFFQSIADFMKIHKSKVHFPMGLYGSWQKHTNQCTNLAIGKTHDSIIFIKSEIDQKNLIYNYYSKG